LIRASQKHLYERKIDQLVLMTLFDSARPGAPTRTRARRTSIQSDPMTCCAELLVVVENAFPASSSSGIPYRHELIDRLQVDFCAILREPLDVHRCDNDRSDGLRAYRDDGQRRSAPCHERVHRIHAAKRTRGSIRTPPVRPPL